MTNWVEPPLRGASRNPTPELSAQQSFQRLAAVRAWIDANAGRPLQNVVFIAVTQDAPNEVKMILSGSIPKVELLFEAVLNAMSEAERELP